MGLVKEKKGTASNECAVMNDPADDREKESAAKTRGCGRKEPQEVSGGGRALNLEWFLGVGCVASEWIV
jgi:hypothetical protein